MDRATTVLLTDPVHPNNQHKTFPYGAGCVGAFVTATLGDRVRVQVFRTAEAFGQALDPAAPTILGFTNYVWNLELGYELVRRAKALHPRAVVIMGGPNYPNDAAGQRAFFERYPLVDFYVYKEGEVPFGDLVHRLLDADLDAGALKQARTEMPGVHYLVAGELVATLLPARERNLDVFPSPYLLGLLDGFFGTKDLVPLVQTKRGCPFQCTFCVEGESYYTKLAAVTTDRFRAEIEYIARRAAGGPPVLHIADSNFGMYNHDLELCDVIAEMRNRYAWPETIEVSTGKNRKDNVLEAVSRTQGAMRFGPALQTTDRQTLENIKRSNISETVLMDLAHAATELDQRSYTELILNLPGETVDSHKRSIRAAMEAGMQRIKMYPLVLLPGTEMATAEMRQEFGIETRFRIMPLCHGTHRFRGETFPSIEPTELVIGTRSMPFVDYLAAKQFELSVEIFYNDVYLEEVHGLVRALGLSMFEFVERCHEQFERYPEALKELYAALRSGVTDNLWESRDECLAHYRDAAHLEQYAREEYKNSLGALKAVALLDHIEAILHVAEQALLGCLEAARLRRGDLVAYVRELMEYSSLRRRHIFDSDHEPEGTFTYAFDRIMEREFRVDPTEFRLESARRMRFWHDEVQARDIAELCAEVGNPVLRARSFIYPQTDPGVNPYLRRSRFC
jgi:radical SAM superfamily enzyme YgiQ (UPF0313 family)